MNIRKFLFDNNLTSVWLCDELWRRGITVRRGHLSRIISGERNSPFAIKVRTESVDILSQYEKGVLNNAKINKTKD